MDTDPAPFVDAEARTGLTEWIGRILEHAAPQSLVAGGASEEEFTFKRRPRNHDELKLRESIYLNGGPVTAFIDTRAMMMYGTGVEFQSEDLRTDDEGRTVDEFLSDLLPTLDLHFVEAATHTYWAGDAWPEIVENRKGGFSHLNLVDPTTLDVSWDDRGQITDLTQVIVDERGRPRMHSLDTDLIGHYWHKRAPGGPLGQSLVEQNMDEIETYAKNAAQRRNAIRLHGSPHYSISVGSEGQSIPDKLMRRVRNRFRADQTDEETNWVHGGDIEVKELDTPGFEGMQSIIETDIASLAMGFNVPIEWTNFGSAGLGEGTPAKSRLLAFERVARTEQRLRAEQFMHDIVRVILDRYSPFPPDIEVSLVFGDVVSDQTAVAEWLSQFAWAFHRDEIREQLNQQAWDDADPREAPPEIDPNAEAGGGLGGAGGLFGRDPPREAAPDPLDDRTKRRFTDGGADAAQPRALLHTERSEGDLTREEIVFEDIVERVLWADETERSLFSGFDDEQVPEFAIRHIREAIMGDALFGQFENVPDSARETLRATMLDSLEKRHGWSIDSIRSNLMDAIPGLDKREAEVLARTETASIVNTARETGYEEQFDLEEERFYWQGPEQPGRTTDACSWLKAQTNPQFGGTPVPLSRLKELIEEAPEHDDNMDNGLARPNNFVVHPQERHTFVRSTGAI